MRDQNSSQDYFRNMLTHRVAQILSSNIHDSYFQIGLVLALQLVYGVAEVKEAYRVPNLLLCVHHCYSPITLRNHRLGDICLHICQVYGVGIGRIVLVLFNFRL